MTHGLAAPDASLEERARDLAAAFKKTAAAHDRSGTFPTENFTRLHAAGLLALRTPRAYGGLDGSLEEAARVISLIGEGEPATALVLAMQYIQHGLIARSPIWPAHLKAEIGRSAVEGGLINALRAEAALGSPTRGGLPETLARRTADGWRLDGHKIYGTGSPVLSWMTVWARTDERPARVGTFLVPAKSPGVTIEPTWDHVGLRASGSHDVRFANVELPADYAIDVRLPEAWSPADSLALHTENGVLLAALYQGVGRAARDSLITFLMSRHPTGLNAALTSVPRIREALGDIEAKLRINERLIKSLAQEIDSGAPVEAADAYLLKSTVTNNVVAAIDLALRLTGNNGLKQSSDLQRHYRDALCGRAHTPQDDSTLALLGERAIEAHASRHQASKEL
jgi:alkylation response protein AidB-like acyl-CoA dehydrogenase